MKILNFGLQVSSFLNFRTVVSFGCLSGLECESLSDKKTSISVQKPLSGTYRLLNKEVLTWLVEFELCSCEELALTLTLSALGNWDFLIIING